MKATAGIFSISRKYQKSVHIIIVTLLNYDSLYILFVILVIGLKRRPKLAQWRVVLISRAIPRKVFGVQCDISLRTFVTKAETNDE